MSTGEIRSIRLRSQLLKGNPLKNPIVREALVYTPPNFKTNETLPCLFYLPGFGSNPIRWSQKDFPMHRVMDYMILSGSIPRSLLVCIDGSTRLGGSQYVDSKLNGPFARHIVQEWIPKMESAFKVRGPYAICGHSSGGFGSLHLASLYPDIFHRVGSFAGDLHFELTHKQMLADIVNDLRQGRLADGLTACLSRAQTHYILGLGAAYSPNPNQKKWKMDLPIDLFSAEIIEPIWKTWLTFDPLHWKRRRFKALKQLDRVYLSSGQRDQHQLHLGVDAFVARCKREGIDALTQSFETDHKLLISQIECGIKAMLN